MSNTALLYDQLLNSPHIEAEIKQELKECMVIEASNVSNYYFQGSDQEYWDMAKDFPNIAPPFEKFFLEFHAPAQIISKEKGARPWDKQNMPLRWGVLCTGIETERLTPDLDTPQGRTSFLEVQEKQITGLHMTLGAEIVQRLNESWALHDSAMSRTIIGQLSYPLQRSAQMYLIALTMRLLLNRGEWHAVKELLTQGTHPTLHWRLAGLLFAQFSDSHMQHQLGPFWGWETHVGHDGRIFTKSDGDVEILSSAQGVMHGRIAQALEHDHEKGMELFTSVKDGFQNFLNTTLLAISFMHCKNVVLNKQVPVQPKLTPKQKRWKITPRPLVTYHVLDIEPMKQVLKTEGQSEKTGIQRALHICRGHFAHYDEEHKLFGKYAGTFWIPQHARGSQKVGVALKDYHIKKPRFEHGATP